ncbi:hypothetical protein PMAYCL1PPCAC_31215, partial [Pristionchus mayeri]
RMSEFESWTDSLPRCTQSGIGVIPNAKYSGGIMRQTHEFMHKCLNLSQNGVQFYGIFCAYNGDQRAAKYVSNRLVYEIFVDRPISVDMTPEQIQDLLSLKFQTTSTLYDQDVNELLVRRLVQKEQLTEESQENVMKINAKLRAATTVLAAVIVNDNIYVINCGNSRPLAIHLDNGNNMYWPLSDEHDMENHEEVDRLRNLGVDTRTFVRPSRSVGDCFRGICYQENEELRGASGPPIISTPDVYVWSIEEVGCSHLLLCSDSVVRSIEEIGVEPEQVNQFLLNELIREKDHTQSRNCNSLAQAVLDSLTRQHRESAGELYNSQHDDMSLVLASLSEIIHSHATRSTMTTSDATNSLSLEDTVDSDESNEPRSYVDCDEFNSFSNAIEVTAEIQRLFEKIKKRNIAKDSIEEEGDFSIDL